MAASSPKSIIEAGTAGLETAGGGLAAGLGAEEEVEGAAEG